MTIFRNLLISLLILLSTTLAIAEPHWVQKPIQCGHEEEVLGILEQAEEKAIMGALGKTKFDSTDKVFSNVTVYLFVNTETKTFTIIEYNIGSKETCVLSFGDGINFDVADLFAKKQSS
jgi:hypothetical protein